VIGLDAEAIFADFPQARILQVVRSPFAGFADMHHRHPTLDPAVYAAKWALVNGRAAAWAQKTPNLYRLIRYEDLLMEREKTVRELAAWLGIAFTPSLLTPSWNGVSLKKTGPPFGGVREIDPAYETAAAASLTLEQRQILAEQNASLREFFSYSTP
jgi:hypothetical protein